MSRKGGETWGIPRSQIFRSLGTHALPEARRTRVFRKLENRIRKTASPKPRIRYVESRAIGIVKTF